MGYLVSCPTCHSEMSSNARRCPYCGETEFIEKIVHRTAYVCPECNGAKKITDYVNYAAIGYYNGRVQFSQLRKFSGIQVWYDWMHGGEGGFGDAGCEYIDDPRYDPARLAIKKGDYCILTENYVRNNYREGDKTRKIVLKCLTDLSSVQYRKSRDESNVVDPNFNAVLFYNKQTRTCSECDGSGRVYKETVEYRDIRRSF